MTTRNRLGITLLAPDISLSTMAMDLDQAMSALGSAKAQGLVGEQADGYLGVVNNSGQATNIATQVNAARRAEYQKVVNNSGASLADVKAMAGKKAMKKAPVGQYAQVGSKWVEKQREGSASALGCCSNRKGQAVSMEFFLS